MPNFILILMLILRQAVYFDLRERQKNMEKENNIDESDFNENEIPDLNSLKPFEFEPKNKHRRY